ncbi:hypothetical protein P8C59_008015 [Phyllachora maydis]|uniref:threonine--tRNA ligase n=1 Tax=Phyllachora maydis TaxID=1825666 RepID=A0AAD9IAN7_9PEZI|nr:hypothetical protein P8C59_008015 [Phyllachora maydis]
MDPSSVALVLGVRQKLFLTSIYSPGSPIFLPRGTRIFNRLVGFLRDKYQCYGFDEVVTPNIYKKGLWRKSGHLDNYADDMFSVTSPSSSTRAAAAAAAGSAAPDGPHASVHDDHDNAYRLKPMNCPGHCLIFAAEKRSYRDLPIRYADFSALHRDEISGALSGLTRVRRFHQDDGHIFCRPSQVEAEIASTLDFVRDAYADLGLGPYRLALSTRPADHYIGAPEDWDRAEAALKRALHRTGLEWTINEGDGAFYGPKIDVILKDSDGKEHQTATVQLDFQLPKRFALEYQAPAPELEQKGESTTDPALLEVSGAVTPVLIHRAVLGSLERLMALLIERYQGKWPFWLNPRQCVIITVNDTEPVLKWARRTQSLLLGLLDRTDASASSASAGAVRRPTHLAVDIDESPRSVSLKVREAKQNGYGLIAVIGPKNVAAGTVTVDLPRKEGGDKHGQGTEPTPEKLLEFMLNEVDMYR